MNGITQLIEEETTMKLTEKSKLIRWTALIAILVGLTGVSTPSNHASANASTAPALMGITVTNNSSRTISHLYVSALNPEVWSADLISQPLTTGQSYTITDVSCSGNEIKVIAEDQQGCFSYAVLSCAQATTSWTVTNDTQVDCGN
jgi:hypothetical protein